MEDLSRASLEDVRNFFKAYYAPNNASLCIAGDIDPKRTRELVNRYFGSIPPGPPVDRLSKWVPRLDGARIIKMKDNVSLPRIYMAWHTPAFYEDGDAEFDILASVLADGKNSRLYRSLVYEKQIAQDVLAIQDSKEIAGTLYVIVTGKPGQSLDSLQAAVDEELKKLSVLPPSAEEIEVARNAWEAIFLRGLQSVGGFGGKADLLNQYNVFVGRPDYFKEDIERYFSVTPQTVELAIQRYLDVQRRVVLHIEPAGDLKAESKSTVDLSQRPQLGPPPGLSLPSYEELELSSGLSVRLVQQHELPLVQFNLIVDGGWATDPPSKPGIASLASDLQDEGTVHRNALQISEGLKRIGANLQSGSGPDTSSLRLNALKKHLRRSLEIMADVLLNPTFPEEELARKKKDYQARILQQQRQPYIAALNTFMRYLFGADHPYGQPITGTGTPESVEAITRADLVGYYDTYFHPNNSTLIVVGDIGREELVRALEDSIGSWQPGESTRAEVPKPPALTSSQVFIVDKPDAAQSAIVVGHMGLERNSPDYASVQVLNTILGGKFTSRLNMNLREEKGYTYGARSAFSFRKGLGYFLARTQVQSEFTKESLVEVVKELRGLQGEIPVGEEELEDTKKYVALRYPRAFETVSQIAAQLEELVRHGLPPDSFNTFIPSIRAVDRPAVEAAAGQYIRPDQMLYVVVGDKDLISQGIEELDLGEIHYLDLEGNPITW
jgi:zinc protease